MVKGSKPRKYNFLRGSIRAEKKNIFNIFKPVMFSCSGIAICDNYFSTFPLAGAASNIRVLLRIGPEDKL